MSYYHLSSSSYTVKGPQQGPIRNQGSNYIEDNFPLLDKFNACTVKRVTSLTDNAVDADDDDDLDNEYTEQKEVKDKNNLNSRVHDHIKHTGTMRGSTVKDSRSLKEAKHTENISIGKISISIILVVILLQVFNQRKRSKRAEKSV